MRVTPTHSPVRFLDFMRKKSDSHLCACDKEIVDQAFKRAKEERRAIDPERIVDEFV